MFEFFGKKLACYLGYDASNRAKQRSLLFGGIIPHWQRVECHNPIHHFYLLNPNPIALTMSPA